jgi:hypothetical protein
MEHLTLADEIVVLMLGDEAGAFKSAVSANIAVAGGILMELALLGRIDTDLTSLFIVDPKPVGDELLDRALVEIAAEPMKQSSTWWIEQIGLRNGDLATDVLRRLVQAGILREENRRFLWRTSRRTYPQNTGREEREAKGRLMSVIFDDGVPNPRDTLLLSLAESVGILKDMLSPNERRKASKRIAQVVAMEEISRSVRAVESSHRTPSVTAETSVRGRTGLGQIDE